MAHPVIESLFAQLESSLQNAKPFKALGPVYIYGAGNVGKDVCRVMRERGIPVQAFLDRNPKPDAAWQQTPILKPDDPAISAAERQRAHVVIGIFNRDTEMPPIPDWLRSIGYNHVTSFLEIHDKFPAEIGDRFWLTARAFYTDKKEQINAVYGMLADDASRDLFAAILKFRFTQDYTVLPPASWDDQYFAKGLPGWPRPIRLVDCGAFDGDTVRQLFDRQLPVEAIAAFEPDPLNYEVLAKCVAERTADSKATVCLFPCGVSATTTQIRFASGQGSSSCASETGDTVIQCVALDSALTAFRPNLIKMDIEGAEYDALHGARGLIESHHPGLAISVYHRAEHLWSIPLLSQSWLKGGRHFLRGHAFNGFELIYYWMP